METSGSLQKNMVLGESGPTSEAMIQDIYNKNVEGMFSRQQYLCFPVSILGPGH